MVKVSKKILQNKRKIAKFKTKKLKVKSNLKGGTMFLEDNLDPANDDMFQAFSNIMKMNEYDVDKQEIKDKFFDCLSLVIDMLNKLNEDPYGDYTYDNNQILRELANNYDNMELKQICHGLENFVVIYLKQQNIKNNSKQRVILDKLYDEKMKINMEFEKELKEREKIYEQLERFQNDREPLIKNMVGGGRKIFNFQNILMFMGILPLISKVVTGNFSFNIIANITGKELEKLRNKILRELIVEDPEKIEEFIKELKELLKSPNIRDIDVVNFNLSLNIFLSEKYLGKKSSWESTVKIKIQKGGLKINTVRGTLPSGGLDAVNKSLLPIHTLPQKAKPSAKIVVQDPSRTQKSIKNLREEITEEIEREMVNPNNMEKFFNKMADNNIDGLTKFADEYESSIPEVKFIKNLKDLKVNNDLVKMFEQLKFKDVSLATEEVKQKIRRFEDLQVDLALHMKNKRMKKYLDDLKILLDGLGIIWDLTGMSESSSVIPKSDSDYGKILEGSKVKFDLTEGVNMFDLPAALYSLSNEQYVDFIMEIIPFLITWLPKVKGFNKLLKKFKKSKKKKGKLDSSKSKKELEKQNIKIRNKAIGEHTHGMKSKTNAELQIEKGNLQIRSDAIDKRREIDENFGKKNKELQSKKDDKNKLLDEEKKIKAELEEAKAKEFTPEQKKTLQDKKAELETKKAELKEELDKATADFNKAKQAKIKNEEALLSGISENGSPTKLKYELEAKRAELEIDPIKKQKLEDPEFKKKLEDPEIQEKIAKAQKEKTPLPDELKDFEGFEDYSEALRKNNKAISDFKESELEFSISKKKLANIKKEIELRPKSDIPAVNLSVKDGKIDVKQLTKEQKNELAATKKSLEKRMKEGDINFEEMTRIEKSILFEMQGSFNNSLNSMFKSRTEFPLLSQRSGKFSKEKLESALKPQIMAELFDPKNLKLDRKTQVHRFFTNINSTVTSKFNRIEKLQLENMTRLKKVGQVTPEQLAEFKSRMKAVKEQSIAQYALDTKLKPGKFKKLKGRTARKKTQTPLFTEPPKAKIYSNINLAKSPTVPPRERPFYEYASISPKNVGSHYEYSNVFFSKGTNPYYTEPTPLNVIYGEISTKPVEIKKTTNSFLGRPKKKEALTPMNNLPILPKKPKKESAELIKLRKQKELADLKVDFMTGNKNLLNLEPRELTEFLGDLPTEILRTPTGKLRVGLKRRLNKIDVQDLDNEGFKRFKSLRRELELKDVKPDELLKRRKKIDLQDRIDDLNRKQGKLSKVEKRDLDIDVMRLEVLKGEKKIDFVRYSELTKNKELQREYKDFLKGKRPEQEALLQQKMLYELDPGPKRLEELKQAEIEFKTKEIPEDVVDIDDFREKITRRIENKYDLEGLEGLDPVKQAQYMEFKSKQFDLDLLKKKLDSDLSLEKLKVFCRDEGIDFEKAIGFPLVKEGITIRGRKNMGSLSGEGLPKDPAELQTFLKRKIVEREKYFKTKKTSLNELNEIGKITDPEVLKKRMGVLLSNKSKHREKLRFMEERYNLLKLEAKNNLKASDIERDLKKVFNSNFSDVNREAIESYKKHFPREFSSMVESIESQSESTTTFAQLREKINTDLRTTKEKLEYQTNMLKLEGGDQGSLKRLQDKYKRLQEQSENFNFVRPDVVEGVSNIKDLLTKNLLGKNLAVFGNSIDSFFSTTDDFDNLLRKLIKIKEEILDRTMEETDEAYKRLSLEKSPEPTMDNIEELLRRSAEFLKKYNENPTQPRDNVVLLYDSIGGNQSGGAVKPSSSNIKQLNNVNVELDRDLELDAMLNIKYRHNVSQKIFLNKENNLLEKFIENFNQQLSKDEISKLKKVSEDKKINYFRYTMEELGEKYFKLNYVIFKIFYQAINVQLKIRYNYDIYPTKENNFNKKYSDLSDKSDEFKIFLEDLNIQKEKQLECYQNVNRNKLLLDKNEISYEIYESIVEEFEEAKQSILDFISLNENSENKEIKKYINEFYEIQQIKNREEELTTFNQLMDKDLNSYQNQAARKLEYYLKVENLCKEEIVYIKNEFNLVRFMNLIMKKKNKLQLFEVLKEMKTFLKLIIDKMLIFNEAITSTLLPEINKEEKVIEGEKKFIIQTLKNIKLEKNKIEFQLKMIKREKIFELFTILKNSINSEILLNKEIISRATEFINYIDFEINSIDSADIHKKINQKFRKKDGIIQLSNTYPLRNKKNTLHIKKNKLTNILREVETLTKRKKLSKEQLKKLQNNRMNNIDKLVKDINNLAKKESVIVPDRQINKLEKNIANKKIKNLQKIKNTKKQSILKMSKMSRKYAKFNDPLELLEQKGILTKKKNKYMLNKSLLKTKKVKITKKMNNLIKKINKNVEQFNSIKSNKSYYNN